jgi:hypothetical protein
MTTFAASRLSTCASTEPGANGVTELSAQRTRGHIDGPSSANLAATAAPVVSSNVSTRNVTSAVSLFSRTRVTSTRTAPPNVATARSTRPCHNRRKR